MMSTNARARERYSGTCGKQADRNRIGRNNDELSKSIRRRTNVRRDAWSSPNGDIIPIANVTQLPIIPLASRMTRLPIPPGTG
jgi:hypothetical protein